MKSIDQQWYEVCREEVAARVELMRASSMDKYSDRFADLQAILDKKHELKKLKYGIGD